MNYWFIRHYRNITSYYIEEFDAIQELNDMKKWEGIEKRFGIKLMYLVLWNLEGLFENVEEGLYWNVTNYYYYRVVTPCLVPADRCSSGLGSWIVAFWPKIPTVGV